MSQRTDNLGHACDRDCLLWVWGVWIQPRHKRLRVLTGLTCSAPNCHLLRTLWYRSRGGGQRRRAGDGTRDGAEPLLVL